MDPQPLLQRVPPWVAHTQWEALELASRVRRHQFSEVARGLRRLRAELHRRAQPRLTAECMSLCGFELARCGQRFGPQRPQVAILRLQIDRPLIRQDSLTRLRQQGGRTIAESRDTAVVFGMPQELVKRGGAGVVLPCHAIARQLCGWLHTERASA